MFDYENQVVAALSYFGPLTVREITEKVMMRFEVEGALEPRVRSSIGKAVHRLRTKGMVRRASVTLRNQVYYKLG